MRRLMEMLVVAEREHKLNRGYLKMTFGPLDQKSFLFCRTCGQSDHKWNLRF